MLRKRSILLAVISLLLASEADAASLAEAKRGLQKARADLSQVVKRIEKSPTDTRALDAGKAVLSRLKSILDANSKFEPKDLDYAKAALSARKDLREKGIYIDKIRSEMSLHQSRGVIKKGLEQLAAAVKRIQGNDPSDADFKRAWDAANALGKELEAGKAYLRNARYAAEHKKANATLKEQARIIDRRQTEIGITKRKVEIERAMKALDAAVAPLSGKTVSDAQFQTAEAAAERLSKLLEKGESLELDKGYASFARKTRQRLAASRKLIDTRWSEIGLSRLKAEVEPARGELVRASKRISRRNTSKDDLALARNAAIVVSSLLKKYEKIEAKKTPLGQYVRSVRQELVGVQINLHQRRVEEQRALAKKVIEPARSRTASDAEIDAALKAIAKALKVVNEGAKLEGHDRKYLAYAREVRRQLNKAKEKVTATRTRAQVYRARSEIDQVRKDVERALKLLDGPDPTDDQIQEARTAQIVLRKQLEATKIDDWDLKKYLREQTRWSVVVQKMLDNRVLKIQVSRQKAKVNIERKVLSDRMRATRSRSAVEKDLVAAEKQIDVVLRTLDLGKALTKKSQRYGNFNFEIKKRMKEDKKRIAERRLQLLQQNQTRKVQVEVGKLKKAMGALGGFGPKPPKVKAARAALAAAKKAIASGVSVEKKISDYRRWAKKTRRELVKFEKQLERAALKFAGEDGQAGVEQLIATAQSSLTAAALPDAEAAQVRHAKNAVTAVHKALAKNEALIEKNRSYANFVMRLYKKLPRLEADLVHAQSLQTFRKNVVEALLGGTSAFEDGGDTKNLQLRERSYKTAVGKLGLCVKKGRELVGENARLKKSLVAADGQNVRTLQIIEQCDKRGEKAQNALAKVQGVLTFHSGPSKLFQAGESLRRRASGASGSERKNLLRQAMSQYMDCISEGKILRHRNPELKDRKMNVGGQNKTLTQLIDECKGYAKKLKAEIRK